MEATSIPSIQATASVPNYTQKTKSFPLPSFWKYEDKFFKVESKERVISVLMTKYGFVSITNSLFDVQKHDLIKAEACRPHEFERAMYDALGIIGNFPADNEEDPNIMIDQMIEDKMFSE